MPRISPQCDANYSYEDKADESGINNPSNVPKSQPTEYPRVHDISDLEPGDHVIYYKTPFDRNGIVTEVNTTLQTFTIVRLIYKQHGSTLNRPKFAIKVIQSKKEYGHTLRKVIYNGPRYTKDEIVARATHVINKRVKPPYTNIAHAFPVWCCTGQKRACIAKHIA